MTGLGKKEGEKQKGGSHERPPPTGYGYQSGGSGRQEQEGFRKLAAGLARDGLYYVNLS